MRGIAQSKPIYTTNNPVIIYQKIICAFVTLILAAVLCTPSQAQILRKVSRQVYETLDPHIGYDWHHYHTLNPICANLTMDDARTSSYILDLAERVEYSNGNHVYTFYLDPKRLFHDGTPITAKDVAYSLNRVTDPDVNSPGAVFFKLIKGFHAYQNKKANKLEGVEVIDKHTIRITLTRPSHSFMYALTTNFGCIIPDGLSQKELDFPISGGPFKVVDFKDNIMLRMVRADTSPTYSTNFKEAVVETNVTDDVALAKFANDEVDVVIDGLSWSKLSVDFRKMVTKEVNDSKATTYISLNTTTPPFNDLNVRKAANYAINRDKLIKILGGAATKTTQIPPPGFSAYLKDKDLSDYNPDKARELLKSAGKTRVTANLYAVDTVLIRQLISSITADLRAVGIIVTTYFGSHDKVLEIAGGEVPGDMVFSDSLGWIADYPEVSNFYFPLFSKEALKRGGWNWSHYHNPVSEQLALEADAVIGRDKEELRLRKWRKVFAHVEKDVPWIPLYNRRTGMVLSSRALKLLNNEIVPIISTFTYMNLLKSKRIQEK